jgi:TatD DNase family protein
MLNIIDTHAHLQWKSFDHDRRMAIERAKQAGISTIINIGYDIDSCEIGLEMAKTYDGLYAALGIHPHESRSLSDSVLARLEKLSRSNKVVAIGESGLDFYRNLSPKNIQKEAFEKHLILAGNRNLPIVVHVRDAYKEVYEILSKHSGNLRGVIHCWSGDSELAKAYLDLGFYLSVAGPVTYSTAVQLKVIAKDVPLDRLVVETDCPWLAPQSQRGERNEPSFLPEVITKIADLRNISAEAVAKHTTSNARRLFNIEC